MDREHAFRIFDVILETVKEVEGDSPNIRTAFRDLELILARRGTYRSHLIPNGMIQGWTGTCDTIMHAMIRHTASARLRTRASSPTTRPEHHLP